MTNSGIKNSVRKTARQAGILYLIFALIGIYLFFIHPSTTVSGDAAATAQKMLANEMAFRIGKALSLLTGIMFIFLVFLLYRLFNPVNTHLANLMAALVIVALPVGIINDVVQITALGIYKGVSNQFFYNQQLRSKLVTHFVDS